MTNLLAVLAVSWPALIIAAGVLITAALDTLDKD